ncbi:MAG TPA: butyrate kinase, partial [Nitrospirota bacterium]
NPGSTSTKLAYYEGGERVSEETIEHDADDLARFPDIASQQDFRMEAVAGFMEGHGIKPGSLDAIAARGGLLRPVGSGVYRVNGQMVADLKGSRARMGREHASSLGCMLALTMSEKSGVPAFTADPVTVDELDDVARVSGVPEIERRSQMHALNIKAVVRLAAARFGLSIPETNFVVAHIGGGISVAAVMGGRIVDVNNALLGMGPFSPQRAGALPIGDLVAMAYSGKYDRRSLENKLVKEGGLMGYLGTSDTREVERRIETGDKKAGLVYDAMAYQISKEVAAMSAVLCFRVDAVLVTGGAARSDKLAGMIRERVGRIARVKVFPGEHEMDALAYYAAAALTGEEDVRVYG